MMKILFLARSTLFTVYGGDRVQILATAKYLRKAGIEVDLYLDNESIDYSKYDLLHLFNITRPANLLPHVIKSRKPYVISTIFLDHAEYEKNHRSGLGSTISKQLSPDKIEYLKTWARWIKNGDAIYSKRYVLNGHRNAVEQIANGASLLLPNSKNEYNRLIQSYNIKTAYHVIYNGVDPDIFHVDDEQLIDRDANKVLCVGRIEGRKNQLNLIKALNNTRFSLKIIGDPSPNNIAYYNECKKIAAGNISFENYMPEAELVKNYLSSQVHVLPSWNETCGLSSMEAAYMGCNIVITDRGDTTEYYGNNAWYCNPADPRSIYNAIEKAAQSAQNEAIKEEIQKTYNWQTAADETILAYEYALNKKIAVI